MNTTALCVLTATAAIVAAAVGHHLRPAARQRRALKALDQRRRQLEQQIALEWVRVRGQLAIHDPEAQLWRLISLHPELHDLQTLTRQRGGV